MSPFRLLLLICIATLFMPLPLWGQEEEEALGAEALQGLSDSIIEHELSNGLRVLMYPRGNAPVFAGVVSVKAGGVDELPGKTGAAHLFEHMAFKGTTLIGTKDPKREKTLLKGLDQIVGPRTFGELSEPELKRVKVIREELETIWESEKLSEEYRKRGGVGLNATTSKELTNYFIRLPKSSFEFWCWLESERLRDPSYRQFYKERDVVMEERRMRYENDPGGKLYEALLKNAFSVHPYKNPVIGYEEEVSRLTPSDVQQLYEQFYVPSNIVVSIVGDVSPERDLPLIEKYFGRLQGKKAPKKDLPVEPPQDGEKRFLVTHPTEPQLAIAYRKPNYPHPDDAAISVFSEVFAGGKTSPVYQELIQDRKIAVQFGAFEAPGVGYPNLLVFYGVPRKPHSNEKLLQEFDQLLKRFKLEKPSKEDVRIAKRTLALQQLTSLKSNLGLARDLAHAEQVFGDWRTLFDWYEQVMRVDAEDVLQAARKYFTPETRTIGMIQREEQG